MGRTSWLQGTFKPMNPKKYLGKIDQLFYRSSWELALFRFLDNTPEILRWSSETIIIPYYDAGTLNEFGHPKQRRYYVDVMAVVKKADGTQQVILIEVKPKSQTKPPRRTSTMSEKTWQTAWTTWLTNSSKWSAAREYCKKKGYEFIILTEDQIFAGIDKTYKTKKRLAKKPK